VKPIQCPMQEFSVDQCPWEGIPGKIRDHRDINVQECSRCKLVIHEKNLRDLVDYGSGSMHNWAGDYGGSLIAPAQDLARRLSEILELRKKHGIKTILDFGSGSGEMLDTLSRDFSVAGLEPDENARLKVIGQGYEVFADMNEVLSSGEEFDLVTLFHVAEHFYLPFEEFGRIAQILKPGGLIIIETPNSQDALLTFYNSLPFRNFTYWSHHPMLHSHKSISEIVQRIGFEIIENRGVQRYGLANHLHWLSQHLPGGHNSWSEFFAPKTESSYASDLEKLGISDTIWLVGRMN